jgi:hypothetical protein
VSISLEIVSVLELTLELLAQVVPLILLDFLVVVPLPVNLLTPLLQYNISWMIFWLMQTTTISKNALSKRSCGLKVHYWFLASRKRPQSPWQLVFPLWQNYMQSTMLLQK